MKTKKCSKCGEIKPLDEFYKDKKSPDGYKYVCKTCGKKDYIDKLSPEQLKKHNRNKKRKKLFKEGKSICSECGKIKPLTEFNKNRKNPTGYMYICKDCYRKRTAKRRGTYKKYNIRIKREKLIKENKYLCAKCGKVKSLDCFDKASNYFHGYHYVCKDCRSKYQKKLRTKLEQNPKWIKHRRKLALKRYYNKKDDPQFKLNASMRSGIWHSLKGNKNGKHWEDLVGYTLDGLKKRLEKQFDKNMTWKNHGSYWHIDHIIPKSKFNFSKPEHIGFKKCWALENLQPLEAIENIKKSDKLSKAKQEHLMI